MKIRATSRSDPRQAHPARIVATERGLEVRCPEHGHLLGILDGANRLVIKCGRDEYVIVEVREAE